MFPGNGPTAFLSRGRGTGGTVTVAPPDPSGGESYNARSHVGISGDISTGGVLFEGRLPLGVLSALIVGLVLFYLWTRSAQG